MSEPTPERMMREIHELSGEAAMALATGAVRAIRAAVAAERERCARKCLSCCLTYDGLERTRVILDAAREQFAAAIRGGDDA